MTCCHNGAAEHGVQFYDDEASLVRAVVAHIGEALDHGGTGVVVARPQINDAVRVGLASRGIAVPSAETRGSLVVLDAEALLGTFMRGGAPDPALFQSSVGGLVARAASRGGEVRVFGEMVAVLWSRGEHGAALSLEELWNVLATRHRFSLLCGYSMSCFPDAASSALFERVCELHGQVRPSGVLMSGPDGADRVIAHLQQRAAALDQEAGQRRKAEAALREAERRLRVAMGAGRIGTWEFDGSSGTLQLSEALQAIHGFEPGEFDGTLAALLSRVHPEDRARVEEMLRDSLASGSECYVLYRVVLPHGGERWVEGYAAVDRDSGPVRLTGVSTDITARKQADAAAARLAAIVESSDDAIASKTLKGVLTSWNRGAERILGYKAEEIIGRSVETLIPRDRRHEEAEILAKVSSGQRVESFETQRLTKDGRLLDVAVTVSPIRDATGVIIGASKILRDITPRKQAEREHARLNARLHEALDELRASNERLEAAVAERTHQLRESHARMRMTERMAALGTLSAGIGHDMGNLLLPIHVRIQSLEDCGADAQDVAAIRACVEYLQRLAKGLRLLALDPEQAGDEEPVDLASWWADVGAMMQTSVSRGVSLESRFAPGLPRVLMPRHQLTQMVFNLVQNAGHATRHRADGRVVVEAEPDLKNRVVLRVSDNGVGMSAEVRARCLEPFFTTRTRSLSTGLGLSLVVSAVERAGGRLEIDSTPGEGTVFTAMLPAVPAESSGRPHRGTATTQISSVRTRSLVTSLLHGMGVTATSEDDPDARLLVVDDPGKLNGFLNRHSACRIVVLGGTPGERTIAISSQPRVSELREALRAAVEACYSE